MEYVVAIVVLIFVARWFIAFQKGRSTFMHRTVSKRNKAYKNRRRSKYGFAIDEPPVSYEEEMRREVARTSGPKLDQFLAEYDEPICDVLFDYANARFHKQAGSVFSYRSELPDGTLEWCVCNPSVVIADPDRHPAVCIIEVSWRFGSTLNDANDRVEYSHDACYQREIKMAEGVSDSFLLETTLKNVLSRTMRRPMESIDTTRHDSLTFKPSKWRPRAKS